VPVTCHAGYGELSPESDMRPLCLGKKFCLSLNLKGAQVARLAHDDEPVKSTGQQGWNEKQKKQDADS
jgi:hypothetical protein